MQTGSVISQEDAATALRFHNKVRSDVGVGPLQWSPVLATYAQAWAEHLASSGCAPKHRPREGEWKQQYGENIFMGSGKVYRALEASQSWYSEIKQYRYSELNGKNWYKTGHYTQMVWRNTTAVGMGMAGCKDGSIIIVANYNPPGNMMGEKPY